MKRFIAKKYIIPLLVLFFLFKTIFGWIECFYLEAPSKERHPIDVHAWASKKAFDWQYVIDAKHSMYKASHYYESFLPLDLLFPIVYSLLFLSCLLYCSNPVLKKILTVLIAAGAVCDWSEDLSFAVFLGSQGDGLSHTVAFFTTIKTILFIANILLAIFWIAVGLKQLITKK